MFRIISNSSFLARIRKGNSCSSPFTQPSKSIGCRSARTPASHNSSVTKQARCKNRHVDHQSSQRCATKLFSLNRENVGAPSDSDDLTACVAASGRWLERRLELISENCVEPCRRLFMNARPLSSDENWIVKCPIGGRDRGKWKHG